MSVIDSLIGKPLPSDEEEGNKVGVAAGVPLLGLDALASSAYGPEAALTVLIPIGVAGLAYVAPVTGLILALLFILNDTSGTRPSARPSRPQDSCYHPRTGRIPLTSVPSA